jgi:hypothetical protein
MKNNGCPKCKRGYLSCKPTIDGKWLEYCLENDCDYQAEHQNRRIAQIPIEFTDRRGGLNGQEEKKE